MHRIEPLRLPPPIEGVCLAICHDLRGPLATASTAVHELGRGIDLGTEAAQYVDIARESLSKAEELLAMLPDLLSSEPARVGAVDLDAVVRAVHADVRLDLELCNGELRVLATLPPVIGDANRLRIALRNLVRNAIRYRRDDVRLEISVRAWASGNTTTLTIVDNGLGCRSAHDREGGMGIGLALARRTIETSGGSLRLSPRRGPGSIAAVTLRAAPPYEPVKHRSDTAASRSARDSARRASPAASSVPHPQSARSRDPGRSPSSARQARAGAPDRAPRSP